jgi:hypothetical protein
MTGMSFCSPDHVLSTYRPVLPSTLPLANDTISHHFLTNNFATLFTTSFQLWERSSSHPHLNFQMLLLPDRTDGGCRHDVSEGNSSPDFLYPVANVFPTPIVSKKKSMVTLLSNGANQQAP